MCNRQMSFFDNLKQFLTKSKIKNLLQLRLCANALGNKSRIAFDLSLCWIWNGKPEDAVAAMPDDAPGNIVPTSEAEVKK